MRKNTLILFLSFVAPLIVFCQTGNLPEGQLPPDDFNPCPTNPSNPLNWSYTPNEIFNLCGKVGIGISQPVYPFHVAGQSYFNTGILLGNQFNPSMPAFIEGFHILNNARPWMRFTTSFQGQNRTVFLVNKDGGVYCTSLRVRLSEDIPVPDFVFRPNYRLMPLWEVKQFISLNSHLPGIPSETEIREEGLSIEEMQMKLLQKIEELTLYMIQMSEENERMRLEIIELQSKK